MIRSLLGRVHLVLGQIAIRPLDTLAALAALPRYLLDLRRFRTGNQWDISLYPCLFDRSAGAANLGEYFWQDLYVARRILAATPVRHVDVGSRIDGFIAHLACHRSVEVYDIRPLDTEIPNVRFHRWDMLATAPGGPEEAADSVSCLHTLEHLGLGRYGDPIDPDGWKRGLIRLAGIVQPGGTLWLSVPVGRKRVEFNAHRVFDPREIRESARGLGLVLDECSVLDGRGSQKFLVSDAEWELVARERYGLGIFLFHRPATA